MAADSPQLEDGFTRIANELLEAIIRSPFSKRELQIVLTVIRKTYGFGKKADVLSLAQVSVLTGIDRANVSRSINELCSAKVLLKRQHQFGQLIELNKNYKQWQCCQNSNSVANSATEVLPIQQPQKKPSKRNNKTSCPRKFSDDDLLCAEWMFKQLLRLNPEHKKPNLERWADEIRLMCERDKRDHRAIAELFQWANRDPFWQANILSPAKLRDKWDALQIKRRGTGDAAGSTIDELMEGAI